MKRLKGHPFAFTFHTVSMVKAFRKAQDNRRHRRTAMARRLAFKVPVRVAPAKMAEAGRKETGRSGASGGKTLSSASSRSRLQTAAEAPCNGTDRLGRFRRSGASEQDDLGIRK
jgi:hypothetical protein